MESPRPRRVALRLLGALLLLLVSAAAGLYTAAAFAPERLRSELERHIAEATGEPCEIGRLRLVPGLPIEIEGRGITLWNGALRVESAVARVSLSAALMGRLGLSRLELEGARMPLRLGDDAPPLPWAASTGPAAAAARAAVSAAVEDAPAPLQTSAAIEAVLRAVLGGPLVADTLRVRRSRLPIHWSDGERSVELVVEVVQGRLTHSRLRGVSELTAVTRVIADGASQGLLEWEGRREHDAPPRLSVAATQLDLAWVGRVAGARDVRARGVLSGVADYHLRAPGEGSVDVDVVARDFALVDANSAEYLVSSPRVAAELRVAVDAQHLEVSGARLESGDVAFGLDAVLARPVGPEASLGLTLRLADIDLARTRELVGVLPEPVAGRLRAVTSGLEGGRIASLVARGGAALRDWRDTLTGHTRSLPRGLELELRVADVEIALGERDRIAGVSGALAWHGDVLEIRGASGRRAGVPLPTLDLELDGVSHLFAANLEERVPPSREILLPGMGLLLSLFESSDDDARGPPPRVALHVDRLEHPALLWPVRGLEMDVRGEGEALVADVERLRWAQVPFRGEIRWQDDPERLHIRFEAAAQAAGVPASAPDPAPVAPAPVDEPDGPDAAGRPAGRVWASGRFEVGPMDTRLWRHEWLRGRFDAAKARVRFRDLEAQLVPLGQLTGHGHVDLGEADALPYGLAFAVQDVDAGAVFGQAGLGEEFVTGRVDLRGRLDDRYVSGTPPFSRLSGQLDLEARDGAIEQTLPAVLALTLASDRLEFTGQRETIRYERVSAALEVTDGVVATDAFTLDGPDVRVFGSGTLDLARPPHRIDAELAVFLFRPVDWAIGAVPILNTLLLGESQNLVAAHFELVGPWDAPVADAKPLRTLTRGSMEVMKGIPRVVLRGVEMLGGLGEVLGADGEPAPPDGDATSGEAGQDAARDEDGERPAPPPPAPSPAAVDADADADGEDAP